MSRVVYTPFFSLPVCHGFWLVDIKTRYVFNQDKTNPIKHIQHTVVHDLSRQPGDRAQ